MNESNILDAEVCGWRKNRGPEEFLQMGTKRWKETNWDFCIKVTNLIEIVITMNEVILMIIVLTNNISMSLEQGLQAVACSIQPSSIYIHLTCAHFQQITAFHRRQKKKKAFVKLWRYMCGTNKGNAPRHGVSPSKPGPAVTANIYQSIISWAHGCLYHHSLSWLNLASCFPSLFPRSFAQPPLPTMVSGERFNIFDPRRKEW